MANHAVDFDIRAGEVHTLLGENGAGKSTLMNILSGMYTPDGGEIVVKGAPVQIRAPRDALALGVGMVHQHFALTPTLTVLENIILGFEGGLILGRGGAEKKLRNILREFDLTLDLDVKVRDLSVGEQQRVEIVKALHRGSEVLILDEPTSVLSPIESKALFNTIAALRDRGKAVVFITHKLNEALEISDRVTILKRGAKAAEMSGPELRRADPSESSARILRVMFGGDPPPAVQPREKNIDPTPILEMTRVVCMGNRGAPRLKEVDLTLRKGEIYGVAGVDGNGQKELAEAIGGQREIASGTLLFKGADITRVRGPAARVELGISYITDDGLTEGCAPAMSLAENAILRQYGRRPFSRRMVIDEAAVNRYARELIGEFHIKASGPSQQVGAMSGGNIQKLLLARELSRAPEIIVCNKPTHGLDAKTTLYVQERLQAETRRGAAVLLISSDLDELLRCADRVGVLYVGELRHVGEARGVSREEIGGLMLGGDHCDH
ncbi:MAG: ABC transporter ATP-binding protein [Desulfobacterales bacterium]|nr:ABC transporter ATP-binding protein [Desulfobacterales bacterium]